MSNVKCQSANARIKARLFDFSLPADDLLRNLLLNMVSQIYIMQQSALSPLHRQMKQAPLVAGFQFKVVTTYSIAARFEYCPILSEIALKRSLASSLLAAKRNKVQ